MIHPEDVIAALSSPPGPGGRAVVRLSGPGSLDVVKRLWKSDEPIAPRRRYTGILTLHGFAPVPADLDYWPPPRTYTGQEIVELHLISSPPVVDRLLAELYTAGARPAEPGEFTMRAFLAGKLDLTRAEAVLGVIEAGDRDELTLALAQLAGNVARPLETLRSDLLDLLADLEAGLDFADEDISFINRDEMLLRLTKGLAEVTLVQKQLDGRSRNDRPFRVALVGRPNAGKSRLFNALTGAAALVSAEPGTTRDYLSARVEWGGRPVELIDTAGVRQAADAIEAAAIELGGTAAARADLRLWCVPAGEAIGEVGADAVVVATKCDLADAPPGVPATSAATGAGLEALRALVTARAVERSGSGLAPSVSRCRHHVAACLQRLRDAHHGVLFDDPPEVVAVDVREALDHLGSLVGAVYTEDLLDRIFSRFCIGK